MRRQNNAYALGQKFFNPVNKNTWIIYCSTYDEKSKDWDYILIMANESTPKLLKVTGSILRDKWKRRELELI